MFRYVQVTIKLPENHRRTVRLKISTDSAKVLTGYEVTKEGEHVTKKTNTGHAECFFVIAQGDIVKRVPLRMNLHYGELEPEA